MRFAGTRRISFHAEGTDGDVHDRHIYNNNLNMLDSARRIPAFSGTFPRC
jgi:hypothetical protein